METSNDVHVAFVAFQAETGLQVSSTRRRRRRIRKRRKKGRRKRTSKETFVLGRPGDRSRKWRTGGARHLSYWKEELFKTG